MADEGRSIRRGDAQPAPWVFDVLLGCGVALVLALVIAADVDGEGADGWAYLLAVGLGALMLVRRRFPVLVLVCSVVALLAYYASGYPAVGVAVPLAAAAFSAAEAGRLLAAVVVSAAWLGIGVAYRLAVGQDAAFVVGYELPGNALMLAAAIALGDGVRSRRELRLRADEIAGLVAERVEREAERRVISERLELARELHDSVGHALVVVALHAQVVDDALDTDEAAARRSLRIVSDTASATIADLRRTVTGLRQDGVPVGRAPLRLADLAAVVRPAELAGIDVRTNVDVSSELSPTVEATVYRIVQESITNVVRHSGASRVVVDVAEEDGSVCVSVVDDGGGAPPSAAPGHGIAGMRERTHLLGGTFTAEPGPEGFAVRASIPLEVPA